MDTHTVDTSMVKALQRRMRTWGQTSIQESVQTAIKASGVQTSMVLGSALMIALGHSAAALTPAITSALEPEVSPLPPTLSHSSLSQSVIPIIPSEQATALRPKATLSNPYSPVTPSYAQPQLDYFLDIAMGSEYGNVSPNIRKWETDLRIQVHGNPTTNDLTTLNTVIHELNALIDPIELELLPSEAPTTSAPTTAPIASSAVPPANVNIHFVPYTEFDNHVPHYQVGNLGYAWIWWEDDTIYDATILISSVGLNTTERTHLIREELTQSLGLLRDSYRYEDSIFFQLWTTTTNYSAMDEALIQMLYSPKIQPGMNRRDVLSAFSGANNTDIAVLAD